jgi:hypothetical protein
MPDSKHLTHGISNLVSLITKTKLGLSPGNNHVLMDNWRPDGKVGGNQTGFWGAISFPSMSVKDQSLLVPFVMLNACLIFSWPNNVPFDHEASGTIQAGINSYWQTGAEGGMTGHEE